MKKGCGGIKIYDTPGLVKKKNLDSFQLIKLKLYKIFDKIHIIFFFIKAQSNLEQCIDMLKFIRDINLERSKKNIHKIPIIFIKNGEDLNKNESKSILFQELKKQLQKYNLLDLYDSSINQNNKKKDYNIDNFFDDDEDNNNNYDNYIEGNIIQIHIPTGKNINKIFSTTKQYVIKNNDYLLNNSLLEIKKDVQKLIDFYILEKKEKQVLTLEQRQENKSLIKKCNDIVKDYKNKCSLLYNLEILNKKSNMIYENELPIGMIYIIFLSTLVLIPLALPILKVILDNQINQIALLYGFGEKDLSDYGLDKYVKNKGSEIEETTKGENNEQLLKNELSNLTYFLKILCII